MLFPPHKQNRTSSNVKIDLESLCEEISQIRKRSESIMLVPGPTGSSWRGIYNGALGFAPDHLLPLPQYYSRSLYSEKELEKLCSSLVAANFSKIIFSGFPSYFSKLISFIHRFKRTLSKEVELLLIYHGSLSSNREDDANIGLLKTILELHHERKIHRIGFIKKGMSETFQQLTGITASHLIPKTSLQNPAKIPVRVNEDKTHVGVFTHDQYRKNIDNQIAAALMIPNAMVHTHRDHQFEYLQAGNRFCFHPFLESYSDFIALIKSMSINFYVTFSECFGLFITESLSVGVPCLASNNSGIFDYDRWLHDKLVVEEFDNSNAIYEQAKTVLNGHSEISERGILYVSKLNSIAHEKYLSFLNA